MGATCSMHWKDDKYIYMRTTFYTEEANWRALSKCVDEGWRIILKRTLNRT
jgi:hypothetical protein